MAQVHLEIVTPEKIVVSEKVDSVVAPGTLGPFGVFPGHTQLLTGVVPGEVRWAIGDREVSVAVTSGFAEVADDKVSILVDAAEHMEEIDIHRAEQALDRARKRLFGGEKKEPVDVARAEAALSRALARLNVARKKSMD